MTERELIIDAVRRLNRAGIAYFLKGSMASNYWGIPRTTHALAFVVQLYFFVRPHDVNIAHGRLIARRLRVLIGLFKW